MRKKPETLRSSRKILVATLMLAATTLLSSCSMYHKKFDIADEVRKQVDFVIQADDVGKFWNPEEAVAALTEVTDSASKTNTLVVVFVHGWHHNAGPSSKNLQDFKTAMRELRARLSDAVYAESRHALTQTKDFRAIGIYLGWRGRSLPSFLDYATFWGRKATAERVGEGDFREFMLTLNRIYEASNPDHTSNRIDASAADTKAPTPFMGLVSIGHSFGGQVLLRATQPVFEANLISAGAIGHRVATADTPTSKPLKGFGDLVVLVNPAAEALQFDRIDRLSKSLNFPSSQPPLMLVVSAASDDARSFWFPLGRLADASLRADLRPDVREMWGEAFGSYDKQWTHKLEIVGAPTKAWQFDPEGAYVKDKCKTATFRLTGSPKFLSKGKDPTKEDGVVMTRLPGAHPNSPFVVANVPTPDGAALAVVTGHNEIWEEVFGTFVTNYAALTQGQRILFRRGALAECTPETRAP